MLNGQCFCEIFPENGIGKIMGIVKLVLCTPPPAMISESAIMALMTDFNKWNIEGWGADNLAIR